MVILTSLEERRRRSRNFVFVALILLITIWSLKLAFPQHTLISVYQSKYPIHPISSALPTSTPTLTSSPKSQNPNADKWKTKPAADFSRPDSTFNGTISNKAAVIIESRFRANIIPLILHFSGVLGHSWPILIYTSAESVGLFASSAALARYLRTGVIQVKILPQTTMLTDPNAVSDFLMTDWLWKDLAPAEHILIFQSDSMLCANAARSVDDFFEYDLIGPPLKDQGTRGYNGGLSLRKRSTIIKVLEKSNEEETPKRRAGEKEDQWFYDRIKELQEEQSDADIEPSEEGIINLPTMEVARTFSVESIDYPHPLGVHGVRSWQSDQMDNLDQWCPEYRLCSDK